MGQAEVCASPACLVIGSNIRAFVITWACSQDQALPLVKIKSSCEICPARLCLCCARRMHKLNPRQLRYIARKSGKGHLRGLITCKWTRTQPSCMPPISPPWSVYMVYNQRWQQCCDADEQLCCEAHFARKLLKTPSTD